MGEVGGSPRVRYSVQQPAGAHKRAGLSAMARDSTASQQELDTDDDSRGDPVPVRQEAKSQVLHRVLFAICVVFLIPLGYMLSSSLRKVTFSSAAFTSPQWTPTNVATVRGLVGSGSKEPLKEVFECDRHNPLTDHCNLQGDVRIDLVNVSINLYPRSAETPTGTLYCAPHPRKWDHPVMSTISNLSMVSSTSLAGAKTCQKWNNIPGVIVSVGGYCGGVFHDFNEVLLPLFQTVQQYKGEVIIILADLKGMWWLERSKDEPVNSSIISLMTNYPLRILGADSDAAGNKQGVECFEHLMVGPKHNLCLYSEEGGKEMRDEIKAGVHLKDFGKFVAERYFLPEEQEKVRGKSSNGKWVLGFTQRQGTRRLENYQELLMLAEARGFHVIPIFFEKLSQREMVSVMRRVDIFVGVHGAAFVNCIFMRECAVVLQIMPYGEWGWLRAVGREYKNIVERLSGNYMEYHVPIEHSSLRHKYNMSHEIIANPDIIWKRDGELAAMAVYHYQDVYVPPFIFDFHLRHIMQVLSFQEGTSSGVFNEHSLRMEAVEDKWTQQKMKQAKAANEEADCFPGGFGNSILVRVPDPEEDPVRVELMASISHKTAEIYRRPDGDNTITNITATLREIAAKRPKKLTEKLNLGGMRRLAL